MQYAAGLPPDVRSRYEQKICSIQLDPYNFKNWKIYDSPAEPLTTLNEEKIFQFLVNRRSEYTNEPLDAKKALQAYDQYINDYVSHVLIHHCKETKRVVLKCEVKYIF